MSRLVHRHNFVRFRVDRGVLHHSFEYITGIGFSKAVKIFGKPFGGRRLYQPH